MQPSFSNDGTYSMIPFIENPNLYKQHFSQPYKPSVGDVTLLCEGNVHPNIISNKLTEFQTSNKKEIDSGEIDTQIGGGDVQLVSPSQGVVDRAKIELEREYEQMKKLKSFHSLTGRGKGKVKNNKGKTSSNKTRKVKSKASKGSKKANKKKVSKKKSGKNNTKKTNKQKKKKKHTK